MIGSFVRFLLLTRCEGSLNSGSFIKPTVYKAIEKIVKLLKEVDGNLKIEEWSFFANKPGEIPSQRNDFDCGVFACMYARSLVSTSPMIFPNSQSISDVRCYMILELHRNSLLPIPPNGLKASFLFPSATAIFLSSMI